MDRCDFCKQIQHDFESLPDEEDAGLPHRDLISLSKFADQCALCHVVFMTVKELAAIIHNEETQEEDNPYSQHNAVYSKEAGCYKFMHYSGYNDIYGGPIVSGPPSYTGPVFRDPFTVFKDCDKLRAYLFGSWWKPFQGEKRQLIGLGVRVGTSPRAEDGVGNSEETVHLRGSSLRFRTAYDSPYASLIPGRVRATDSSCKIGFDVAYNWLCECNTNHACMPIDTTLLPTRVLDVGEPFQHSSVIKLVESGGFQVDRYIALSHCWGKSHRIKTTKTTLEEHKRGIPLCRLPATFQDAIECARRFGVRWLWIDTLCIIQDDETDWVREAAQMGAIYTNAYLTLSAAASTDDSSGMFPDMDERIGFDDDVDPTPFLASDIHSHGRPGLWNVVPDANWLESSQSVAYALSSRSVLIPNKDKGSDPPVLLSPEWMPSSTRSRMLTYRIGEFGRTYDPLEGEPLSARAWTLQERLLAPRVLHYASDQMYWECREGIIAEDGATFPPGARRVPPLTDLPLSDEAAKTLSLSTDPNLGQIEPPGPELATRTTDWAKHGLRGRPMDRLSGSLMSLNVSSASYKNATEHRCKNEGANPTDKIRGVWTQAWKSLVREYSTRALTREEDKLPALSGIAYAVAKISGDKYIAGHWQSMLLDTLAWRPHAIRQKPMTRDSPSVGVTPANLTHWSQQVMVVNVTLQPDGKGGWQAVWEGDAPPKEAPRARRSAMLFPGKYRAPSWSWAAVDTEVEFTYSLFNKLVARLVRWEVEAATEDPFGRVKSGWIKVRAPLLMIRAKDANAGDGGYPYPVTVTLHSKDNDNVLGQGDAYFDEEPEFPSLALVLSPGTAIILKESGEAARYRRVGVADLNGVKGLEKAKVNQTKGLGFPEVCDIEEMEKAAAAYFDWVDVIIV